MTRNLEAQIDELYRLPLGEFTKARNALAKTLSGSHKKQVGTLAKPSVPAWVINQAYWHDPPTYRALIDAAEKLRAAHRAILSGRKTDTRTPDQLHRATVEKAFAKAIGIAETRGLRLTTSVSDTVRRTLVALPGDEAAGRLTRSPEPAGFSLVAGVKLRPESKVQSPKSNVQSRESKVRGPQPTKPPREELQAQRRAERERKEADRKTQIEREKRTREIRKAEEALRDAERRLAELKG
jgi:hypothetical protein